VDKASTISGDSQASAPGAGARITLAMLCFVYVLNFLDRQLISILAKPIQDGLHISDGQLGMLTGFYFALFYCFIAIPIGWLADRTSRVQGPLDRLRDVERRDRGVRTWRAAMASSSSRA
jgi:MFS family permease